MNNNTTINDLPLPSHGRTLLFWAYTCDTLLNHGLLVHPDDDVAECLVDAVTPELAERIQGLYDDAKTFLGAIDPDLVYSIPLTIMREAKAEEAGEEDGEEEGFWSRWEAVRD
jgi:hypothetical protein